MNEMPPPPPPVATQSKTSALAIWSLVLSILGFALCLTIFTAIPGVICAHLALGRIKRSGGMLTGRGLAIAGMVVGYVAIAFLPLMAAIAIPNFVKAREMAQMNLCIMNLRQIELAKQQWALKNKKESGAIPTEADLAPFVHTGSLNAFKCPAGGTYTINGVDTEPTCSIPNHALTK